MSMHEALRKLRNVVPWLSERAEEEPPAPVWTSLEDVQSLVLLATAPGQVERTSATWAAVARWAANELIMVHVGLETATADKAAALRSRAKTLRDLLVIDDQIEAKLIIEDQGPYVP